MTQEIKQSARARHSVIFVLQLMTVLVLLQYSFSITWSYVHRKSLGTTDMITLDRQFAYSDLGDYRGKLMKLHTASEIGQGLPVFNYPAPAAFIYHVFFMASHPTRTFLFFVALNVIFLFIVMLFWLRHSVWEERTRVWVSLAIASSCLLPYPIFFLMARGNLEGVAFALFSWGFVFFLSRREMLTAFFWGLGLCIKPFPVLLFLLLLGRRKLKEIAASAIIVVTINCLALAKLGGSVLSGMRGLAPGLQIYKENYILNFVWRETRFKHSLLDAMKYICARFVHDNRALASGSVLELRLYHLYLVIAPLIAFTTFLWFRKKFVLNQTFAIVLMILLLTPVSADYTSWLLYLPFSVWIYWLVRDVAVGAVNVTLRSILAIGLPLAILFTPQNYVGYSAGILHTLLLFFLLAVAAVVPMPCSIFTEIKRMEQERPLEIQPHLL